MSNDLFMDTDDTVLVVGALLATAVNLVRDPGQGAAYGDNPEAFILLADRIATAFVLTAVDIAVDEPTLAGQAQKDCSDIAHVMASGIAAYRSYREIEAEVGEDSIEQVDNAVETLRRLTDTEGWN